jgi:hypothetical protein
MGERQLLNWDMCGVLPMLTLSSLPPTKASAIFTGTGYGISSPFSRNKKERVLIEDNLERSKEDEREGI